MWQRRDPKAHPATIRSAFEHTTPFPLRFLICSRPESWPRHSIQRTIPSTALRIFRPRVNPTKTLSCTVTTSERLSAIPKTAKSALQTHGLRRRRWMSWLSRLMVSLRKQQLPSGSSKAGSCFRQSSSRSYSRRPPIDSQERCHSNNSTYCTNTFSASIPTTTIAFFPSFLRYWRFRTRQDPQHVSNRY